MSRWIIAILIAVFVFNAGCTTSTPPTITPNSQPLSTTPSVTPDVVTSSTLTVTPSETKDTLCGEVVYCGLAPSGFETQAIKSDRCEELRTLRIQNDQKVMACLKNPYEARAISAREQLQCLQGVGELDYCLTVADKYGMSRESMKSSWCRTNTC